MNYRHAYHAGNFSDVLKHAVLARTLAHLKRKEAPFRVIDTHAGRGRYALTASEATATGEWRAGIARLLGASAGPLPPALASLLKPYLNAVLAENRGPELTSYPGSPCIALRLMRAQDRLIANELHPEELAELRAAIGRDPRAKLMGLDAFVALKALLPPKERRGIVLVDAPFEVKSELERVAEGLRQGLQRFATGIFIVWYPIKDIQPITRFHASLAATAVRLLCVELLVGRLQRADRLNGCGLVIANPPYTLEGELARMLPTLSRSLAVDGSGAGFRLKWLNTGAPNHRPHRPDDTRRARIGR